MRGFEVPYNEYCATARFVAEAERVRVVIAVPESGEIKMTRRGWDELVAHVNEQFVVEEEE